MQKKLNEYLVFTGQKQNRWMEGRNEGREDGGEEARKEKEQDSNDKRMRKH
jgi:hypothetical protein